MLTKSRHLPYNPVMRLFERSPPPLVNPASCILPLSVPLQVSRPSAALIKLEWTTAADQVHIFRGSRPDQIDFSRPLVVVSRGGWCQLPDGNMAARPYFALRFTGGAWHGRTLLGAERILPLAGAVNFRDIGGYETGDGRVVAWGRLYRSGVLSELQPDDLLYLQNLGIRLVCDLRSAEEVEKRPDRFPPANAPDYIHLPAQNLERLDRLRGLAAIFLNRTKLEGLMDEGYTRIMIDNNAALIGSVLAKLTEPPHFPIVIHCSAGKDRTAIIVALLLTILGVPRQTILADYTLSNVHYDKIKSGIAQEAAALQRFGITADHLQAVILVKAERLQKMFDYVEQKYGTVESYLLQNAGLKPEHLVQIRQNLLLEKFIH